MRLPPGKQVELQPYARLDRVDGVEVEQRLASFALVFRDNTDLGVARGVKGLVAAERLWTL